jgi:hypothetical protein
VIGFLGADPLSRLPNGTLCVAQGCRILSPCKNTKFSLIRLLATNWPRF